MVVWAIDVLHLEESNGFFEVKVDANYSGSILGKITLPTSPYKIL
jgi:hypothetical protein